MRRSASGRNVFVRVAATAAVACSLVSCSLVRPNEGVELTPVPWNGELQYGGIDDKFCGLIEWGDIASDLDLALGEVEASPYSGPFWGLDCTVHGFAAAYTQESRIGSNRMLLGLRLFEDAGDAYTIYRAAHNAAADRPTSDAATDTRVTFIDNVAGWWARGWATQTVRSRPGQIYPDISVSYDVYHENLLLVVLVAAFGLSEEGAASNLHRAALAIIEEAKARIPCRSLVDPPVPTCD